MLKEIQDLRSQLLQTKHENERLARENALLKAEATTPTSLLDAPQAEPPLKRKALIQTTNTPPAPEMQSLRTDFENAFTTLKQPTHDEIVAIQQTVQDLHSELLKWARHLMTLTPTSPPVSPESMPLAANIDHDADL